MVGKVDRTPQFMEDFKQAMAEHSIVDKIWHIFTLLGIMLSVVLLPALKKLIFGGRPPANKALTAVAEGKGEVDVFHVASRMKSNP